MQVFSTYKYLERCKVMRLLDTAFVMGVTWHIECDGLTPYEVQEHGFYSDPNWLVDVDDWIQYKEVTQ